MTIRGALVPFALGLSLFAAGAPAQQETATEQTFYKAFWLERGEKNFAEAAKLYGQFVKAAPEHRLAGQAATLRFELLLRLGKKDEAMAFAKEQDKLLGKITAGAPAGGRRGGDRAERGRGRGRGSERGAAAPEVENAENAAEKVPETAIEEGREQLPTTTAERGARGRRSEAGSAGDPEAALARVREQLAAARESGDEERAAQLLRQVQRIERGEGRGQAGRQQGGRQQGGRQQGGRNRARNPLFGDVKIADMSEEQQQQLQDGLGNMDRMMQFLQRTMDEAQIKALEAQIEVLKTSLKDGKLEDAQTALDKVRASMPRRGRRGGGGGGGGGGK